MHGVRPAAFLASPVMAVAAGQLHTTGAEENGGFVLFFSWFYWGAGWIMGRGNGASSTALFCKPDWIASGRFFGFASLLQLFFHAIYLFFSFFFLGFGCSYHLRSRRACCALFASLATGSAAKIYVAGQQGSFCPVRGAYHS
jgi:hypothetical protein